jgi:hypothetical protein
VVLAARDVQIKVPELLTMGSRSFTIEEASRCWRRDGARRSTPIRRKPLSVFDREQRAEHPMGGARLTVHLTIEPGEGLSGSAVADKEAEAIAISGWLGLVEAINLLRRRGGHVMTSPPAGAASDVSPPL